MILARDRTGSIIGRNNAYFKASPCGYYLQYSAAGGGSCFLETFFTVFLLYLDVHSRMREHVLRFGSGDVVLCYMSEISFVPIELQHVVLLNLLAEV